MFKANYFFLLQPPFNTQSTLHTLSPCLHDPWLSPRSLYAPAGAPLPLRLPCATLSCQDIFHWLYPVVILCAQPLAFSCIPVGAPPLLRRRALEPRLSPALPCATLSYQDIFHLHRQDWLRLAAPRARKFFFSSFLSLFRDRTSTMK